jgi:hypothetical protein
MYDLFELTVWTAITITSFACLFIIYKGYGIYRHLGKDRKWISKALGLFIVIPISILTFKFLVQDMVGGYGNNFTDRIILSLVNSPFSLILSTIPLLIALIIANKFNIVNFGNNNVSPKPLSEDEIQNKVNEVWDSKQFLTSLRTVLPSGKEDKDLGVDYIPFMLQNIDERRERYKKSSNIALRFTIYLGSIFVLMLLYFGNLLINDDAAGIGKTLNKIDNTLSITNEALSMTSPKLSINGIDKSELLLSIDNLHHVISLSPQKIKVISPNLTRNVLSVDDLILLREEVNRALQNTSISKDKKFVVAMENTIKQITYFMSLKDDYRNILHFKVKALEKYTSELKKETDKDLFNLSELIKRLAIGVIICSFFLVVLRYSAQIYKEHHEQMLKAEMDELNIRKYYVALKSSGDAIPLRKQSIESLFQNSINGQGNVKDTKMSPQEASIIKELISAVSKKIT